jgi:hypothetical protein
LHEPKWDGFRFQVIKDGSDVRLSSKNGAEYCDRLPGTEKKTALRVPKASWQTARGSKLGNEPPFALRRCSASGALTIHNVAI